MLEAVLELRTPYYCILSASHEIGGEVSVNSLFLKDDYIHHFLEIKNCKIGKCSQISDILRKYSINVSGVKFVRRGLFMALAETPACRLYSCVLNNGCFLIGEYGYPDKQYIRWRLISPSRKNLNGLLKELRSLGSDARVVEIEEPPKRSILTQKQERVLKKAIEDGYFNTPKKTSAKKIAAKLNISASTFSESLRRAMRRLAEQYLNNP